MVTRLTADGCSTFGLELCVCSRCKALLTRYDFGTDQLGRTVEKCPKCGPRLLQAKRHEPVVHASRVFHGDAGGKCVDCGKKVPYRGVGIRASRCQKCQRKRCQVRDLAAYHERRKRLSKVLAC